MQLQGSNSFLLFPNLFLILIKTRSPLLVWRGAFYFSIIWQLPTFPRHLGVVSLAMAGLTALFGKGRGRDTAGKTTIIGFDIEGFQIVDFRKKKKKKKKKKKSSFIFCLSETDRQLFFV